MKQLQVFQIKIKNKIIATLYTTDGEGLRMWLRKMKTTDKLIIKETKNYDN